MRLISLQSIKQVTGLLIVFVALNATGAMNPQAISHASDFLVKSADSSDSILDSNEDSTTDSTVDSIIVTIADSSSDSISDSSSDSSTDTTTSPLPDSTNDTTVIEVPDTSLFSSDSSETDSSKPDSNKLDSNKSESNQSATNKDDTVLVTGDSTSAVPDSSGDSLAPTGPEKLADSSGATESIDTIPTEPEIKLTPAELARKHYQAALTYGQDPTKKIEYVGELTLAIQSDPDYAPPYLDLGVHLYGQKNYKGAEENLKKALELTPTDTTTLSNLGKLYLVLRKRDEAEKSFLAAIEADENFISGYRELGDLFYRQKRYDEAIAALEKYNENVTDDALAHLRVGKAYRKIKQLDKAIEEYKKAISIQEDFAPAYSALGQIYLAEERFAEAVVAYQSSIDYNPKSYRSYFNLAVATQSANPDSLSTSLEAWRLALRMARNNPRVTDIIPIAEIQIAQLEKQIELKSGTEQTVPDTGE